MKNFLKNYKIFTLLFLTSISIQNSSIGTSAEELGNLFSKIGTSIKSLLSVDEIKDSNIKEETGNLISGIFNFTAAVVVENNNNKRNMNINLDKVLELGDKLIKNISDENLEKINRSLLKITETDLFKNKSIKLDSEFDQLDNIISNILVIIAESIYDQLSNTADLLNEKAQDLIIAADQLNSMFDKDSFIKNSKELIYEMLYSLNNSNSDSIDQEIMNSDSNQNETSSI